MSQPTLEGATRRAMATIRGQAAAQSVLQSVAAGTARADALGDAWQALRSDRHALQGFAREVQKTLERARQAHR